MKNIPSKYLKLFLSTLYLSTFTFGGGYVIVTLLKQKFVDDLHWIDEDEMLDMVAIAQSSPGAIAVNGAIVVGYKIGGIPGVLVSVLGAVIPPQIFLVVLTRTRDKCSNPGTFQHTYSRSIEVCESHSASNQADLCRLRVKMGAEI